MVIQMLLRTLLILVAKLGAEGGGVAIVVSILLLRTLNFREMKSFPRIQG